MYYEIGAVILYEVTAIVSDNQFFFRTSLREVTFGNFKILDIQSSTAYIDTKRKPYIQLI